MKAEELRIGNYVLDSGGKVLRIDFFEHLQSGYDCKFGQRMFIDGDEVHPLTEYTDTAKPIPLTEQWLIDFGFLAFGSKGFVSKEAFSPGHPSQRFDIDWSEKTGTMCKSRYQEDNDCFTMRHIKHVHQLQNLYFALTGEELQL